MIEWIAIAAAVAFAFKAFIDVDRLNARVDHLESRSTRLDLEVHRLRGVCLPLDPSVFP